MPGPQFNFQKQNLALQCQTKNRLLWKVSSFVRENGSSSENEKVSMQQSWQEKWTFLGESHSEVLMREQGLPLNSTVPPNDHVVPSSALWLASQNLPPRCGSEYVLCVCSGY